LAVTAQGVEKCQWFSAIESQLATDLFGGLGTQESEQLEQLLDQLRQRIGVVARTHPIL
jgi:hypothetical protein